MPKKPELTESEQQMRLDFAAGVRQLRDRLGASVAELAAVAGVSLAHQYRIEAGERTADVLYLYRIMSRYGPDAAAEILAIDLGQAAEKAARGAPAKGVVQSSVGHGAVMVGQVVGGKVRVRAR